MKPINPTTLTQELIRCASVTPADKGAQDVLKQPLRDMGFEIFDLPFEGNGGSYPVKNFFARLGTGTPIFVMQGIQMSSPSVMKAHGRTRRLRRSLTVVNFMDVVLVT